MKSRFKLATSLFLASLALSASAQLITYVDATDGASGNTKLTNGATWSPQTANQGATGDGLWALRAFGNGNTIYQNAANANTDNAHRLLTIVTNLAPNNSYEVYAYMWADTTGAGWRMGAALTDNPGGELPLYIVGDLGTTKLYETDPAGTDIGATGFFSTNLTVNPFKSAVMVGQGNRRLWQIYLGQVTVTGSSFQVFIDDFNAMTGSGQRTWYDGLGYTIAGAGRISGPTFLGNGDLSISYIGNAGRQYAEEGTGSLTPPVTWIPVATNTADSNGLVIFTNTPADLQAFYRMHDVTLPGPVTNVNATAGNAQVSLSWPASFASTSYNVKRSTANGGPYTTITNRTQTSFVDTGVANNTTYYYVIAGTNFNGEGVSSTQVSATPTPPPPPAAPTGLTATAGNAVVSLKWNASSGATSYFVKSSTVSGGSYTTITNVTATNFVNTGLANGTTYYYVVTATNTFGESANSLEANATPAAVAPLAPTGLSATPGNTQVSLSWTASLGATSYFVKSSTNNGGPYITITNVTATSFINTGLLNGTNYYFVVSATNNVGESPDSSQASATPSSVTVVPLVYAVENTGVGFPTPPLPTMAAAPTIQPLPDPFMWSATDPLNWTYPTGRSTNFVDWSRRRAEIKAEIENYEIGLKPAVNPANIFASISGSGTSRTLTVIVTNVVFGTNRTLTLTSAIGLPASSGTFPAIIGMNSANGSISLNGRAIATINFQHNQVTTYGSPANSNPYYLLYQELGLNIDNTGQYSAWAWGVSRLIDGLYKLNGNLGGGVQLNLERIGVTGCSYAGKMALFCGAFDERVALTIPQESGGGGAPNWRYSGSEPAGTVEWLPNTDHNWFKEDMFAYGTVANVSKLPHDHHELMAMVAPRALFATGNPDGAVWLSNPSCYVSCKAVQRVYDTFGVGDRLGWNINGGKAHCALTADVTTDVTAFLDKFLLGLTNVNTVTNRHEPASYSTIDHARWTDWWGTTNPIFTGGTPATYTNTYEPECATVGSAWQIVTDAAASNGKYVTVTPGTQSLASAPTGAENLITIPFTVPANGTATIFGRVYCATADDDSFWVSVDGGTFANLNGLSGGANWIWVNFGNPNLTAGAHTITIGYREDGARLDKILISDYQFAPTGMGQAAAVLCP